MDSGRKILVINGSYREGGITDQAVDAALEALTDAGGETEVVNLREFPIEFCINCRECMMSPGEHPGECVLKDDMPVLIGKIERAQAFILASPTNMGSVTALFKQMPSSEISIPCGVL